MIEFSTQPADGGTKYQIIDLSTDVERFDHKRVSITGGDAQTIIFVQNILPDVNPIVLDVDQAWQDHLGFVQIVVNLEYVKTIGYPDIDNQPHTYILPTTLNLKQN